MMWVPCITFLLLTLSTICFGDNPGATIQITDYGLKGGVQYLVNTLMPNNTEYQLPNVTGTENIGNEDMKYEFTRIRLVKFNLGNLSSQWLPGTGMRVSMKNGNATINCNWKIDSWLINDSGTGVMTLTGLSISMIMGVSRIDPGVPSVHLLDCQSSVQNVDVQMLGGVSYIYESIKESIQDVVRRAVDQQLCSSIRNEAKKWDQWLSNLKMKLPVNRLMELDLSLVGNLEVSDCYANIGLKGFFQSLIKSHGETAFSPAPMTLPVQHDSMFYVGVSQSFLDSLGSACYSAGFLTFEVSHLVGSKDLTTSELATYMPEISQHFPNPAPVKIKMYATKSPMVFLQSNNLTIQFSGTLQTYVYPSKNQTENLFSVNLVVNLQTDISLSQAKGAPGLNLTGSVILDRLQIEGSETVIKVEKGVVTENGVQQLFQEIVVPNVNEQLASGIYIPIKFVTKTSVHVKQGFAMLAADLK
ncbi:BPI fold-containing family C protein-like [Bufo gargarizans]|uniref:BPI fold-containing family C protein-like n=1 Tax=Bufo gargarizans TaxID=30331 RepID=UPI001CF281CE|nr:BPI fold-containing family C protein-like [Bufo gargarizans]